MKLNVLLGDAYKEGMTADEIISALEKVADPNAEVEKLRNAVTKANGEAAEYKKQLKAKRTDDENAAQEQADKLAEIRQRKRQTQALVLLRRIRQCWYACQGSRWQRSAELHQRQRCSYGYVGSC